MKKLIFLFLFILLLVGTASALNFDNKITYENNDLKVKFENMFGFGKELGTFELKSHKSVDEVLSFSWGEEEVVMFYDSKGWKFYKEGLGEVYFTDQMTGEQIDKEYYFVEWKEVEFQKDNIKKTCGIVVDYSEEPICRAVSDGTYPSKRFEWVRLESNDIPGRNARIGLKTYVNQGDYIDAVWTIVGKKVSKHATWAADIQPSVIFYTKAEDEGGVIKDEINQFNGTETDIVHVNATSGKIGQGAVWGNASDVMNISAVDFNWSSSDWTINAWMKADAATLHAGLLTNTLTTSNYGFRIGIVTGAVKLQVGAVEVYTGDTIDDSAWRMWTATYDVDTTNFTFFLNGVQKFTTSVYSDFGSGAAPELLYLGIWSVLAQNLRGVIDEIMIMNSTASQEVIGYLYNSDNGVPYGGDVADVPKINITLISPGNESILSASEIPFNKTITPDTFDLTNETNLIWFSNGILFNSRLTALSGSSSVNNSVNVSDFIVGDFLWNSLGCMGDGNGTNCSYADINYSFIVGGSLSAQSFSPFVYETESTNFTANVSFLSGVTIYDKKLWYNGSTYSGESALIGTDNYTLWTTFDVPLVNTSSANRTFFWEVTFQREDGSFFFQNLTSAEQNVTFISLTNCSAGTNMALNFSAWNEENLDVRLDPFDFFGTFDYWLGSGSVVQNYSLSNTDVNVTDLCITPADKTYFTNAQVQYEKDLFVKRSHYLVNATLSNVTNHIRLLLLNSSASTSFIIDVIDENQIPVPNVLINIQRYYPGKGIFETTEIGMTDTQGSTIGHFEAETEDYKIIIYRGSEVLFESGTQKVFCRDTPCTLTFQIGSVAVTQWNDFGDLGNLVWSLEYNETTELWYYVFVDTSGTSTNGRLYVYSEDPEDGKAEICNTNTSATAATLTCNVSTYTGLVYAAAYLTYNGGEEILVYLDSVILESLKNIFGMEGLFLSGFILLVLACAGLWNPAVGIILVVTGVVLINFIGLASFGLVTIWGIILIGLILLWLIKS